MNGYYQGDDDDAQVDGDDSGAVNFVPPSAGQPWLRQGTPPWHMWGNTQQVGPITPTFSDSPEGLAVQGQLARVSYKRPESWHWLFAARIISAPIMVDTNDAAIDIYWDVITGLGRAQQKMSAFDHFRWQWLDPARPTPPFGHVMWATSAVTPPLNYVLNAGIPTPDPTTQRPIAQLVAQDIQVNVRVQFYMRGSQVLDAPAVVEVSAFLSPKSHIRPDWYCNAPVEVTFPGDEIGGR
jgi:hypothetical protein